MLDFARYAAKEGVPLIVAAGGDGTVNEVVRVGAQVGAFDVSVDQYISDVDDLSNTNVDIAIEQREPTAVFSLFGDEIRLGDSQGTW